MLTSKARVRHSVAGTHKRTMHKDDLRLQVSRTILENWNDLSGLTGEASPIVAGSFALEMHLAEKARWRASDVDVFLPCTLSCDAARFPSPARRIEALVQACCQRANINIEFSAAQVTPSYDRTSNTERAEGCEVEKRMQEFMAMMEIELESDGEDGYQTDDDIPPADPSAVDANGEHVDDTIHGLPNRGLAPERWTRRRRACPACIAACRRSLPSEFARPRSTPLALTLRLTPRKQKQDWSLNFILGEWGSEEEVVADFDISVCKFTLRAARGRISVRSYENAHEDVAAGIARLAATAYQPSGGGFFVTPTQLVRAMEGEVVDKRVASAVCRQAGRVAKYQKRGFRIVGVRPGWARLASAAMRKKQIEDIYHPTSAVMKREFESI